LAPFKTNVINWIDISHATVAKFTPPPISQPAIPFDSIDISYSKTIMGISTPPPTMPVPRPIPTFAHPLRRGYPTITATLSFHRLTGIP
jgi:hypothetical protein